MKKLIKDILFPVFCVECGREGEWWCAFCRENGAEGPVFLCPVCQKESVGGEVCGACRGKTFLDGAAAFFPYRENSPAGKLIKIFKYQYATDVRGVLEKITEANGEKIFDLSSAVFFAPVPLHPRRFRERGFNQAEIFALVLAGFINKSGGKTRVLNILSRARSTRQQAKLSREERWQNVAGAFTPHEWPSVPPSKIFLVDDVFTTGATMEECAKVLKQNGVKEVRAVTLARG